MYLVKNERGNEVIYQSPSMKSCWGYIKDEYITERDAKKGQIFYYFENAIALQLEVLEYLERKYPNSNIKVYVKNFENENFWAICPIKHFRRLSFEWGKKSGKPSIFNYDTKKWAKYGLQIRLPLNYWVRKYKNQTEL
jgi:hypothetical protein|tara:strand:- start:577 stop:990 length:414 start_codon:yes stop_codon:yes gene_type:complete